MSVVDIAPALREALLARGFDADSVYSALGSDVHAALGRSEPVPVRRAARGLGELGVLIRLFLILDTCSETEAAAALAPLGVDDACASGLLERVHEGVRSRLDLRPVDAGRGSQWFLSDLDGSIRPHSTAADHVLGVGHASLSLLRATPVSPVGSVLDVGTGCGVQALHARSYADRVVGTDISSRALMLARANLLLNSVDGIELREGPWYTPAGSDTFDRIVANPPFVVGPKLVTHSYRESGLNLDGASALMIGGAREHLSEGGTAAMLAAWVHRKGEDWRSRVANWIPSHGVDAWVAQRDVADPALYVGTWMRDGGLDPRDTAHARTAENWLDHFSAQNVEGVGFGFVHLRRTDESSSVLAEDLSQPFDDPLGEEGLANLDRLRWLRHHDVNSSRLSLNPSTALERVFVVREGWQEVVVRVHRGDGPRWQHDIDDVGARLLAGLRADGLSAGDVIDLLANTVDPSVNTDEFSHECRDLLIALIQHGIVDLP